MNDKEYRLNVSVKNNLILSKIEKAGYSSIMDFCKKNKISFNLYKVVNMQLSPVIENGGFIKSIRLTAEVLGCDPWELFTETQRTTELKTNKRQILLDEAEMKFSLQSNQEKQNLIENIVNEEKGDAVKIAIGSLTSREQQVIRMRFGLEEYDSHTQGEIAIKFDLSCERIRQIEKKHYANYVIRIILNH